MSRLAVRERRQTQSSHLFCDGGRVREARQHEEREIVHDDAAQKEKDRDIRPRKPARENRFIPHDTGQDEAPDRRRILNELQRKCD